MSSLGTTQAIPLRSRCIWFLVTKSLTSQGAAVLSGFSSFPGLRQQRTRKSPKGGRECVICLCSSLQSCLSPSATNSPTPLGPMREGPLSGSWAPLELYVQSFMSRPRSGQIWRKWSMCLSFALVTDFSTLWGLDPQIECHFQMHF